MTDLYSEVVIVKDSDVYVSAFDCRAKASCAI